MKTLVACLSVLARSMTLALFGVVMFGVLFFFDSYFLNRWFAYALMFIASFFGLVVAAAHRDSRLLVGAVRARYVAVLLTSGLLFLGATEAKEGVQIDWELASVATVTWLALLMRAIPVVARSAADLLEREGDPRSR